MNELNIINKMQNMCEESCSPDQFEAWENLKLHLLNTRHNLKTKRLCCCIPDQEKLGDQCQNLAEYQIWEGDNPTPDDYTETCAKHLEEMLDASNRFSVLRIPEAA